MAKQGKVFKDNIIAYYCKCNSYPHRNDCAFSNRLYIKSSLINKYNITGAMVPEWVETEVDKMMEHWGEKNEF